jgi:hypothetical protein
MTSTFKGKVVQKQYTDQMLNHTKLAEGTQQRLAGAYLFCNRGSEGKTGLVGEVATSIFACLRSATIREVPTLRYLQPHISKNEKGQDYTFCNLLEFIVPTSITMNDNKHHQSHWDLSESNQLDVQGAILESKETFKPTWCPTLLQYCQNRAEELEGAAEGGMLPSPLQFYRLLGDDWKAAPTLHLALPEEACTFVSTEYQLVKLARASGGEFYACCYTYPNFCEFTLEIPEGGRRGDINKTITRHQHTFTTCNCGVLLPKSKKQCGKQFNLQQGVCFKCTNNTTTAQATRVQQDMSARAAVANSNKLQEQLAEVQKKARELQREKLRLSLLLTDCQEKLGGFCQDSSRRTSTRMKQHVQVVSAASQGQTKKSRTNGVLFLFY